MLLLEERSYRNPASVGNGPGIDVSCFPTHETFIKASYRQGEQTQGSGHADERGQRKVNIKEERLTCILFCSSMWIWNTQTNTQDYCFVDAVDMLKTVILKLSVN